MIVSENSKGELPEFQKLLDSTTKELNQLAAKDAGRIAKLKGNLLEPEVFDIMNDYARGTSFENNIELIGGQKFPDIVTKKSFNLKESFGVEVKTTTKDHWKTTGNSVLESTRVDGVGRIFMLFGKLGAPIEFRNRPYEQCFI